MTLMDQVSRVVRGLWLLPMLAFMTVSGGCATLSEGQCVAGDWYVIGQRDGARGMERARLFKHAEACAPYGTQPETAAYDAGRREGLQRYCTPRHGFDEGREGRVYHGVCTGRAEDAFLSAFRDGKEIHDAEEWLERIERQMHSAESRLDKKDLDNKERKRLHKQLRDLRNDHRRARRELDRVMYGLGGRNPYD